MKSIGDLKEFLKSIVETSHCPAIAVLQINSDSQIENSVGIREISSDIEVTDSDLWHIGSCTKAMTATLVARLVEEETLKWDQNIAELLSINNHHRDHSKTTITDLLSHRAGVISDPSNSVMNSIWKEGMTPSEGRTLVLEEAFLTEPRFVPGSEYLYSNIGYMVIGTIIEVVTGKTFEENLREEVFNPLHMSSAGFGAPGSIEVIDQPRGHTVEKGSLVSLKPDIMGDNPPAYGPAGGVHCSLQDWAKFIKEHIKGPNGEGELLSAESYKILHTPTDSISEYGMGWISYQDSKGRWWLTHDGSNTLWYSSVSICPEEEVAVLVAANCFQNPITAEICHEIKEYCLGPVL